MKFKFTFFFFIFLNNFTNNTNLNINRKINAYLKNYNNFSGVILVTNQEKVIFKKCYGFANYEHEVKNSSTTKFKIASLTKPFVAVAILLLQERNLLNVQDKLSKYISNFPNGDKITIHNLLTHTSGITNYYRRWSDISNKDNLEDIVSEFKSWPLDFEPGTKYSYSNSGYLLLAYIIEKASGEKYEEFLHKNVFVPLEMYDSGHNDELMVIKNRASGYQVNNDKITHAPPINNPITLLGNGNLYSTIDDMCKWDQALYSNKLIKSIESLFHPHFYMADSNIRAHGYGWFIDQKFGKRFVEYSGSLVGFLSKHIRFIDDKISIIILTNLEQRDQFCKIYEHIVDIVLQQNIF